MEASLQLVQQLKTLREAGHFSLLPDLDRTFKVYDYNQKSHAESLTNLGLSREKSCPYLGIAMAVFQQVLSLRNPRLRFYPCAKDQDV